MIRSAVRTTLRSLLRSDLVAELNQTGIDVQEDGFSDGCVEYQDQSDKSRFDPSMVER